MSKTFILILRLQKRDYESPFRIKSPSSKFKSIRIAPPRDGWFWELCVLLRVYLFYCPIYMYEGGVMDEYSPAHFEFLFSPNKYFRANS